ncbi:hypothetical protein AWC38_SpisGene25006, partial [Stylophora pistillata]
ESSFLGVASTSQESSSLRASKVLRVTLLGSEWRSSKGGLSTINRELAIQLAKLPNVDVSVYLPRCSEEDRRAARSHNVHLIEAQELPGHDQPTDWLVSLPKGHHPHCVIGHGVPLGRQVQVIQKQQPCKWIQVVHTAPEELGMFKSYEEAIFRVDPVTLQSSAGFKENESSTSRAVQRKDAVINKSRQASNKEVKRSSSSVATQSVKRRKGSEHCLVEKHLRDEYIRRSNVKPLLWDSDIQLPIDDVYTRLQIKWRRKAYFQLTEKEVHMYEIFKPATEGELPSNRTKLYQIIFRCLLRRYCSRNGLNVHQNADKALENQFKESILVLGELAWNCLLEDRRSFSEEELDKLEHSRTRVRRFPAIKLGLVFMEASSRLSHEPRHQCHFLHKTFQEFLAAFYLANELLTNQPNPTLGKKDVCEKYRQVFFFVAGILGMEGTVFFKQIGTILRGHWNWRFPDEDSKFLLDLLEESGAADHFGKVVCPLISLPINFQGGKEERSCLRLIRYAYEGAMLESDSTPVLTTLSLCNVQSFNRDDVHNFHRILEDSQTLTELVIYKIENMSHDIADLFAESVSSSTSLRKVTLKLLDMSTERCTYNASALLSAFSQLNCVALEFFCILNNTVAEAVKVLLKTSLRSLVLTVYGDLDDCLVSSVSEGLAEETGLESLSLVVHGKLSNPGIVALQNGVLRNRTLHSLELQVYGEIPEAWMTAVATLLAANKSWKSLIIHPSVCGKIKHEESLLLFPIL